MNTPDLSNISEVLSEFAVYNHRGISGELARFIASPSTVKFDVLYKNLSGYLDDVTLENFGDWCRVELLVG